MDSIARMAGALQVLLAETAERSGRECRLIKRQREFTATSLLSTFVWGFLRWGNPKWEQLAGLARELGANVSPQAVEQRITPALRDSLYRLWQAAVGSVVESEPRTTPLLRKFTNLYIGDSTTISLCSGLAEPFPGCGGRSGGGKAALKLQVLWDMVSGQWTRLTAEPGKTNDSTSLQKEATPPTGSRSLFDLGYFNLERYKTWQAAGAHWISRGISDMHVWIDGQSVYLYDWLKTQPPGPIDCWLEVGAARLRCRLIALRTPQAVANRRRQKAHEKAQKKGKTPTARHLETCDWTVFITSCDNTKISWQEVVVLYRIRWQIELLFKLWKSHNLLGHHRSDDPVRQLVELYAKLTAVIIQHWLTLTTCWCDADLSLTKATRLIRDRLPSLIDALPDVNQLIAVLTRWKSLLHHLARIPKRKKDPSHPELLATPMQLTFTG